MPLTIVAGSPFAGKRLWTDREIEQAEEEGAVGWVALDFTALYSAVAPGLASTYRDQRVSDSGASRYAGWLLAAAIREAGQRELNGYALTDSPRRALALAAAAGGAPMVEVVVTQETALRRSQRHVELIKALVPRAAQDDGAEAESRCRKMVKTYFDERDVLPPDTRQVTAPDIPSDQAVKYMWSAAIAAAKRGDSEKRDKWTRAAKRALAARGVTA